MYPPRTCRWCAEMICGLENRCLDSGELMTDAQINVRRECPHWDPVEIDAMTGARWEPHAKGGRVVDGQTRMEI